MQMDASGQSVLNEKWYYTSYPVAKTEVDAGLVRNAQEHLQKIGAARGYLPDVKASRYQTDPESKFTPLWTDLESAEQIIVEKLSAGEIKEQHVKLYSDFIQNGYCIIESVLPANVVDNAETALNDIYNGKIPHAKFSGSGISKNWTPKVLSHPAKTLDMHMYSAPIRDLIMHSSVSGFLETLFDQKPLVSQTLGFWRGSQQTLHQDTAYVTYSAPLKFVGAWTALEDIKPKSGELEYAIGSHRLPYYLFGEEIGVHEARRTGAVLDKDLTLERRKYEAWVKEEISKAGLKIKRFLANKGDVLIWHPLLAHGGTKVSADYTRKSIVTHFCPLDVAPNYFERKKCSVGIHASGTRFSSRLYGKIIEG